MVAYEKVRGRLFGVRINNSPSIAGSFAVSSVPPSHCHLTYSPHCPSDSLSSLGTLILSTHATSLMTQLHLVYPS